MTDKLKIAVIGSGAGLLQLVIAGGLEVVLRKSDLGRQTEPVAAGLATVDHYEDFLAAIEHPRLFLLDMAPGPEIDALIDEAYVFMEPGDVVIDPSGSYWCDTLRRFRRMRHRSLFYVDIALIRPPGPTVTLLSGDRRGVELALPVAERLGAPAAAVIAGEAGAAHFALMVRDTLQAALAHAASEARQLLEAYPNEMDADAVGAALSLEESEPGPRAAWALDDAVRLQAVVPMMAQAVMLELGAALDEHRQAPIPPRLGPFVHPDDIL